MKQKANKLCNYIEDLINTIYCSKIMDINNKDAQNNYHQLIDGLKKIGFRFDFSSPITIDDINFKE